MTNNLRFDVPNIEEFCVLDIESPDIAYRSLFPPLLNGTPEGRGISGNGPACGRQGKNPSPHTVPSLYERENKKELE